MKRRPAQQLLASVFLLSSCSFLTVNSSGIYNNAVRNRYNNLLKFKSLLFPSDNSTSSSEMMEEESNPIKTNGATLPPITEDPHLAEMDELYSTCNGVDVRELTIFEIQDLFHGGKLSSVELTKCYIKRIEKMNGILKTINEINPDAVNEAAKCDVERKLGKGGLGPMHGIPVLLKENIGTRDRMETTAGSLALLGIRPKEDAELVKTLRKAGAVILGKANLSEFAFFRGTNIPSGWSGRGGQTRNAYNLNVTPEGSSSGSAVAVSTNLAAVSIGTETDGSLIAPSNVAGICTLKPTLGLPSVQGVIPISHNQDCAGPMARTVTDLAILLDAMICPEERDASHPKSFTQDLLQNPRNKTFRIGVMRYPFFSTKAINSSNLEAEQDGLNELIDVLKNSLQFDLFDPANPEVAFMKALSGEKELLILQHDFKHDLNNYLSKDVIGPYPLPPNPSQNSSPSPLAPRKMATLKDVISFNEEHPSPEGYNQELLVMSEATDGILNNTYVQARNDNRLAAKQALDSVLQEFKLDAVMTPSESRYEAIIDEELRDSSVVGYSLAAIAGYPSINIPAGIGLKGVPFGVTFIGVPYSEATLLQIGLAVEQLSPQRKLPKFLI